MLANDPSVTVPKASCSAEPFGDLHNAFSSFRVQIRHRVIATKAETTVAMWGKLNGRCLRKLCVKNEGNRLLK